MKYRANPVVVDAYVINEVQLRLGDKNLHLTLDMGDGNTNKVLATPEMTARMIPKPGDYWVVQEDGYIYLNPKAVFERKYSPDRAEG